jgi:hypothetical protein
MDELSRRMQEIGEAVYGAANASNGSAPDGASDEGREPEGAGTVEGEFREV